MSCYSKLLKNCNEYKDVLRYAETGLAPSGVTGLPSAPKAHLVHSLCEDLSRRAVVVLPDEASARKFASDINEFCGLGKKAFFYPARDYSFNSSQGQSREYEQLRLKTLCNILNNEYSVIACSAESALQLTIPPEELKNRSFKIDLSVNSTLIVSLLIFLPIFFNRRRYFVSVDTKIKNNVLLFINIGLIIASVGIVSSFVLNLFKMSGLEEVNNMFNSNGFVMAFVVTVLMAPVVEEIIFRGLIFNRMNSKWNTWIAIIISSFLFGLAHGNLPQMINAFVIGFAFAYFYNKYHTLWPCIVGHVFNNFISNILILKNVFV